MTPGSRGKLPVGCRIKDSTPKKHKVSKLPIAFFGPVIASACIFQDVLFGSPNKTSPLIQNLMGTASRPFCAVIFRIPELELGTKEFAKGMTTDLVKETRTYLDMFIYSNFI